MRRRLAGRGGNALLSTAEAAQTVSLPIPGSASHCCSTYSTTVRKVFTAKAITKEVNLFVTPYDRCDSNYLCRRCILVDLLLGGQEDFVLIGTKCLRQPSEPQQGRGQRCWHQTPEKLPVPAAVSDQSSLSRRQCVLLPRLWGALSSPWTSGSPSLHLRVLTETRNGAFFKNNLKKVLCSQSLEQRRALMRPELTKPHVLAPASLCRTGAIYPS